MKEQQVNIIVPFGYSAIQPEREKILHFVIEQCLQPQTYSNRNIVLVEMSGEPTQQNYALNNCDQYVFRQLGEREQFGPGVVQNLGFREATPAPLTYIHQADFMLPPTAIEIFYEQMIRTKARVMFPFYSAVNLSRPITEGMLDGMVDKDKLYRAITEINGQLRSTPEDEILKVTTGRNRVALTDAQTDILDAAFPSNMNSNILAQMDYENAWGETDGAYSNYINVTNGQRGLNLVNYRHGPRAKASYLATSEAYKTVGGTPEYEGWGFEDLMFWERVKAVFGYDLTEKSIVFNGLTLTTDLPLVHIWHSVSKRPEYFANTETNKRKYEDFLKLSREEKIRGIKPIGD